MLPPDPADCQMELLVQFFQIQADQIFISTRFSLPYSHSTGFRSGAYAGSESTTSPYALTAATNAPTYARRWFGDRSHTTSAGRPISRPTCSRNATVS